MKIGVLGGGQLGRMLGLAGIPLGHSFHFLDPAKEPPAGALGRHVQAAFDDVAAVSSLCGSCDVLTFEFENVPGFVLASCDPGKTRPGRTALEISQDRVKEKSLFATVGVPTARYAPIDSLQDLQNFAIKVGVPLVLKTRRLGYDGKGQTVVRDLGSLGDAFTSLGAKELIAEEFIHFDRELSIIACRSLSGEIRYYPLVENHHRDGILRASIAPAPNLDPYLIDQAEVLVHKLLLQLDYVGILTIELFQVGDTLYANEMAPRVHNSGHWSIEGAVTSQFENHIRAITDLPLGSTAAHGTHMMVNLIGSVPPIEQLLELPELKLHLYGKTPRAGRKLGHLTFHLGDTRAPILTELSTLIPEFAPLAQRITQ